ncbi:hypothetical protein SAMN05216228_100531 [Rhizobium tibeticum]|uniref:Uncharacterized protein n=1 Tax=Rhizobium tibeticum TaxID=501024 RepID=A0A1H8H338_9HYPH|nr:hypothetical protein [Rhizobium tibeticum]SEH64085.1 hypothetical protein RTCCBAU85039_1539 [Rhizobium tibeticum]SEN50666.1 hypothetical protein SAMN05216228_100531 [Rhizobium tibeticum]
MTQLFPLEVLDLILSATVQAVAIFLRAGHRTAGRNSEHSIVACALKAEEKLKRNVVARCRHTGHSKWAASFTIEFLGDGGEVVSVLLLQRAKAVLLEMAAADGVKSTLIDQAAGRSCSRRSQRHRRTARRGTGRHFSSERSGFSNRRHDLEAAGKTLTGQGGDRFFASAALLGLPSKQKTVPELRSPGTFLPPIC